MSHLSNHISLACISYAIAGITTLLQVLVLILIFINYVNV